MTIKRLLEKIILPCLFLFIANITLGQTKVVTGSVVSSADSTQIASASVQVKGSTTGTQTGSDGTFRITVPTSATTLSVSSVGFVSQDVVITGKTEVEIFLEPSNEAIGEVVVIGYGTARKRDLTGAVTSIKAKDFNQGVIAAPDQLLQGKVPGLDITSASGQPGAATTIKIRGNNSIRANNNPLYVIDGVPLDGRTARPSLNLGNNGLDYGPTPESNPLLYINPNDISQIDVLKDASSTAIYGSRGANGVIVITTKRSTTSGTKLEFNSNIGAFAGYMKKYDLLSADEFREANEKYDSSSSVDALKEITQNVLTQNYSLALSGGSDDGKFRASFLGSRIPGFIKKTSLDKYIGSFSGSYKFIDKRLSFDFSLIAGHTTENMGLFTNTAGAGGNFMSYVLSWNPTTAFYNNDGSYKMISNSIPNPLAVIDGFDDVADVNVFLGNISASYKILNNLEYKFLFAINHGTGTRNTNMGGWLGGMQGVSGLGVAAISKAALTSQTYTHTLSFNSDLSENLSVNAVGGYEYWKSDYSSSTLAASQFNTNLDEKNRIPILYTSIFQNARTQFPLTTTVDPTTEIQSIFGRVNLNLLDKYVLTATLRADGSNKFGANNKYGVFPSFGAKWTISNEDFLKDIDAISSLGLRASWGVTGNQEFPSGASLEQFSSGAFNSIGQSNVANPELKWERTSSYNIGLDYSLWNNRISGSIDYYYKNTTDLLFQSTAIQPAPSSIFFINLPAKLINKGIEFSLGTTIISNDKVTWDAGVNFAYNKNKLTDFKQAPIETGLVSGQGVSGALAQIIANDYPVNEYYLKEFQGFNQAGQQIISATPIYAGDPNPKFIVGFSSTIRYDKLSFSFNASGAYDYLIYNNTYNTITTIGNLQKGQNVAKQALGTPESVSSGVAASTRYLESGNYMKLRNATLSYSFGDIGLLKALNVYLSGTNLFVLTKFTGFDPEVNIDKSNNNYPSRNMEYLPYPTPRIITFGVNFGL
jgi:iron complex outermembrane receptor protein